MRHPLGWALMILLVAGRTDAAAEDRSYLRAAVAAASWLRAVETVSGGERAWPVAPRDDPRVVPDLYHGAAGVVLFFLELAAASGDPSYLGDARRGADYLLATLREEAGGLPAGLYTGLSGIGLALHETAKATGELRFREGASRCLELVRGAARPAGAGFEWQGVHDLVSGAAGTGLFLLYAADELGRPEARELAAAAGRRLIEVAERRDGGFGWRLRAGDERQMPNFSHGTAGVAYFLLALHEATEDERFLAAARGGAQRLTALADTTGGGCLVPHHLPGGEELHYLGWCHGPAGTGRLFHRLYRVTGDQLWREWVDRAVRSLTDSGLPAARTPGYWNNVGRCCGAAGVGEFLLDVDRERGETRHRALVRRIADDLLTRATRSGAGLRWVQAEHRVRPELLQAQTGLMQGAAGVGLFFLRLDAAERGGELAIRLPDSP